jgi:hypothetical protein
MNKPIRLTGSQVERILRAAAPLAPEDRSPFLADVAAALRDQALATVPFFASSASRNVIFTHRNSARAGPENTDAESPTGRLPSAAQSHGAGDKEG